MYIYIYVWISVYIYISPCMYTYCSDRIVTFVPQGVSWKRWFIPGQISPSQNLMNWALTGNPYFFRTGYNLRHETKIIKDPDCFQSNTRPWYSVVFRGSNRCRSVWCSITSCGNIDMVTKPCTSWNSLGKPRISGWWTSRGRFSILGRLKRGKIIWEKHIYRYF